MKGSHLRSLVLVLLCGLVTGTTAANADTLANWIGPTGMGGDGNWSTASDWSGGVVPNNGNGQTYSVTLPILFQPHPFSTVNLDISPTIDSLTVDYDNELVVNTGQTLTTGTLTTGGGTVSVLGTLNVSGSVNNNYGSIDESGEVQIGGVLNDNAGLLGVNGSLSVTGSVNQNSGYFYVGPGSLTAASYVQTAYASGGIDEGGTMNVTDATLSGGTLVMQTGGLGSTLNGNLEVNGATFSTESVAGSGRQAAVNGNFTITAASAYESFITGEVWGQLVVSGDASLDGTLDLVLYYAQPGVYDIMTYLTETGQFGSVNFSGLEPGQTATLDYGPTALDVVVVGSLPPSPEPASLLLMGTGILALAYRFRRKLAGTAEGQ